MNTFLTFLMGIGASIIVTTGTVHNVSPVVAYDTNKLPTTIDLNDTSSDDIRTYYSSLSTLSESERQGTNLLKNLKTILKKNQKYYAYDGGNLWAMYEITDRDWNKSPASAISGYDASSNTITGYNYGSSKDKPGTNPYIHALYVNRGVDNKLRAWTNDEGASVSHGGNKEWCIDQEHIWPKSHGFNAEGKGGARGDPMHLWPGDSDVNSSLHNDQLYGYVNITSSSKAGKWSYAKDNYVGTSLTLSTSKSTEDVFEPQDSDKGDIARAIFYMVARYNYLSGEDTDGIDANNPNLELVQSNEVLKAYTSSTTTTGKMGIMTDLLNWHHLDPVDEFEIHRNNLLYKNFTNNRNPFIDFPEWVDYVWGTATYNERQFVSYDKTPTGAADPVNDKIGAAGLNISSTNIVLKEGETKTVNGTTKDSSTVYWKISDSNIATIDKTSSASGENITITAVKEGSVTLKASATIDGQLFEKECRITVEKPKAKVNIWIIVGAVAAGVVVLVIVIVIFANLSKKNKKKVVKTVKKTVKKSTKKSKK